MQPRSEEANDRSAQSCHSTRHHPLMLPIRRPVGRQHPNIFSGLIPPGPTPLAIMHWSKNVALHTHLYEAKAAATPWSLQLGECTRCSFENLYELYSKHCVQLLDELEKPEPFTLSAWAAGRHNSAQTAAQKPPDSCSQTHHAAPARQATGHTAACMPSDGNSQTLAAVQHAPAGTATGHHLGHPGQAHGPGHDSYKLSQHAEPGHQLEMQESRGPAKEMLCRDQCRYSGQESEKQPEHGSRASCSECLTRGNKENAMMHQKPVTMAGSLWLLSEAEAGALKGSMNGSRGPPAVSGQDKLGAGASAADDRAHCHPAPASKSTLPFSDAKESAMNGTSAVLDDRTTMDVSWPTLRQYLGALGLPKLKSSAIVRADKADQQTYRRVCTDQPCSEEAHNAGTAAERPARLPLWERVHTLSKSCNSRHAITHCIGSKHLTVPTTICSEAFAASLWMGPQVYHFIIAFVRFHCYKMIKQARSAEMFSCCTGQ